MATRSPLTLPRRLRRGARVAAVTLSWGGPGAYPQRYEAGVRQLSDAFGVEVVELAHTRADPAFLAAHPDVRAADLHAAFADPDIDGIVSTIGGDDSIRLLAHLDLDVIRANPKVVLGFSDTTVIQLACLAAGLVTFHGPSIMAGFAESGGPHTYLRDGVRRMLFDAGPPGDWPENDEGWTVDMPEWGDPANQERPRPLHPATGRRWLTRTRPVTGPLMPVNLEAFDFLRGTRWWPDLDGVVLALETSEEGPPPHVVTRFLRVLAATGELRRLAALLFATPGGVGADQHPAYDEAITGVVRGEAGLDDLPLVTNLAFGHTSPMWTLPVGAPVRVDDTAETVTFPEPVTAG